ncbi:GHKL domain-containing protein, partial [candidate division KSB1 bacterium]|nr:GHKL domain-containing protein [candidate division KSB1 bacterium]
CDDVKNVTDLDELISTMLHFIGKAVNAPLSTFRFVEHEKANLRVYSTMPDAEEKGLLKKEFREFAPRIISTNEPLRIEDFDSYQNNQFTNLHFPEGYQAYLGMPVSCRNSITGILSVYWKNALKIDARLLDIVTTISLLCAVKIENIRLLDASSQNSDDLKSSNEELENFVYTVSHDLKSPIVSIQGFSSILLNDFDFVLNDESRHYLKRIQTNANQMEALVKDLLELSRIGRVVSPFEEADVREIISKSLDELIYQIEKRGIETNIPDKMPVIFCDKKRISQVFSNLIDNAIKYIGSQNQSPQIEIGCKDENDCHLFFVKDNGLGIPEEFHTQIFGLFRRLSQEDSEEFSTGVGLAIVHRIIENHGGKIWFDSEPEKGSTFYFTIPKKVESK